MMETFNLTQAIALGCSVDKAVAGGNTLGGPAHVEKSTCGWRIDKFTVLWVQENGSNSNCNYHVDADAEYDTLCYNNPNGGNTIFGS